MQILESNGKKMRGHMNLHTIRANKKYDKNDAPVGIEVGTIAKHYGYTAQFLGESTLIFGVDTPLGCGAKIWLESSHDVALDADVPIDTTVASHIQIIRASNGQFYLAVYHPKGDGYVVQHSLYIAGPASIIYDPHHNPSCFIQTYAPVYAERIAA